MRYSFFILFATLLSACSSSQAPLDPNLMGQIPNVEIPDTLNFGQVPLGLSDSLTLQFVNTGHDSLFIKQSISTHVYKTNQSGFLIAPGKRMQITISFVPSDSLALIGFDTIRSGNNYHIITLTGGWKNFSGMFRNAPRYIHITLNGLIGQWDGNAQSTLDFAANDFGQSENTFLYYNPLESGDTTEFRNTYYFVDSYISPNQPCAYESNNTTVWCAVDSTTHSIQWIKATYSEDDESMYGQCGHGFKRVDKTVVAHQIPLTQNGNIWSGIIKSTVLPSTIDNISYSANSGGSAYPSEYTVLNAILGYDSTATLSISIQ
ncbi:MAG TPA: hypothetical protein VGM92_08055 [Candidatus Kapabacteria bacterium]